MRVAAQKREEEERDGASIAARFKYLEEIGVMARVRAVSTLMGTPEYQAAHNAALIEADKGDAPPKNEEDVRRILLGVLAGDPFRADLRDVLLKIRKQGGKLTVLIGPGVEASMAAVEHAKAHPEAASAPLETSAP